MGMKDTRGAPPSRKNHSESIFCALSQTRQPAEVIVVDDGSPDGADLAAALAHYGDRVTLLRKPNGGAAIGAEACSTT